MSNQSDRPGKKVIIEDVFPDPAEATYPSIDAAIEAASPILAKLIGTAEIEEPEQKAA